MDDLRAEPDENNLRRQTTHGHNSRTIDVRRNNDNSEVSGHGKRRPFEYDRHRSLRQRSDRASSSRDNGSDKYNADDRNNQNTRFTKRHPRAVGYLFLEDLLNNDVEKMLLILVKEREGFNKLFDKELSYDIIVLITKILSKICSSPFDTKYNILQFSINEKFLKQLCAFIANIPTQMDFQKRNSKNFWKNPDQFWLDILTISENLLRIPTFGCKILPNLLNSLKIYLPVIEQVHNMKIPEDIKKTIEEKENVVKAFVQDNEKQRRKKDDDHESSEPPDDFRQISVYPSSDEILGGRVFLRKNVIEGPYKNVNHYLDVQFRLLREDFVGPLRESVANYRLSTNTNKHENVQVHKDVHFLNTELVNEFFCVRAQFTLKKKKSNFANSKRFMFGSLLCFTKDNFKTLFFGKVGRRDVGDLEKGQVVVSFDEKLDLDYNSGYLMVECNVFFEPYFHVLTVLKTMSEENFPMERYLIRVDSSVQQPVYLTLPRLTYDIETQTFNPLSIWPNDNFYGLNESQMVAFKAAITQEISVIQGPPGTGKTYLALRVAETLLHNSKWWYHETPMLVICYTNHALDQFLEGIIPITTQIVRVGGQSKNTKLEKFNLRHRNNRDDFGAAFAKRREVQDCLQQIKSITENLKEISTFNGVVSFTNFSYDIPEFDNSWFSRASNDEIIEWLLEGANYEHNTSRRKPILETLQEQQEISKIGLGDDDTDNNEENINISDIFGPHLIYNFDSVLNEVINEPNRPNQRFTAVTLKSMNDQIKKVDQQLFTLMQENNPSFQQQITEQQLFLQLEKLRPQHDYLKSQLARGKELENTNNKPTRIDLRNPQRMSFTDRWNLYFYWLDIYKRQQMIDLEKNCEQFPILYKEYEQLREIEDTRVMKKSLVVGMTTTSAARLRSTLQTLKNPIVIVEEAAEVLEAHIVTSVTKHCKHLILIGDHKQLKPSTANYNLEKQYRLGTSLFERMLINNIHCYTLNVQHRMRPEISSLIRPAIYDFLEDHPSVHQRPPITGIDNCLFFIHHDNTEEDCDGSSKINHHEVSFLLYLARHLVLNGYKPENITILAAYLGQFFAFQKARKDHLDLLSEMRIAVLDNYQGEESDIILLSLVRNNEDNKIGFLKNDNRVCVALSRARNGMYIMGNMDQLCHDNKLWRHIKSTLEEQKALGSELPLRCQVHQDKITLVKSHTDFFSVPEGGCDKICDAELKCGHKCSYLCHVKDRIHSIYKCQTVCNKKLCTKDETHICKKRCFEDCGSCDYLVLKTLNCGHEVNIACHIDPDTYKCQVLVPTKLPCGHATDKPCYCDPETYRCPHICDVQVQPCGHACELICHVRKDPDHLNYTCRKPCGKYMKNCSVKEEEHRCKKLCYEVCDSCTITVRKQRTVCPHFYDVSCDYDVDEMECLKRCCKQLDCGHPCRSKCNEPCQPCQRFVSKQHPICKHNVKVRCSEPPNRRLCLKMCPLKLACGHSCTLKCNDPCTTKCTVLVESLGIKAECGHVVTTLQCYMTSSNIDPYLLIKYCKEPCSAILKCGHQCSGSCGECGQGRVHKRCSQQCTAILVCNHPCKFPCSESCRPCKEICSYRCPHSICRKSCGEVCTSCAEKCSRRCDHQWCRKRCGEICDVPPCREPCKKKLKCGHLCIGFCGDRCPPKCLVCDKDQLLETFFGTETEDARYVFLNDCDHIVENEGMEYWLQQNDHDIGFKVCPKCKTAIKSTQRYSDYIKKATRDVALVKEKANGYPKEIETIRKEIIGYLEKLPLKNGKFITFVPLLQNLLKEIEMRVKTNKKGMKPSINIYEVKSLKSKIQIIQQVVDLCCAKDVVLLTPREIFIDQINFITTILSRDIDYITNQEIQDLDPEIDRLSRMIQFSCIRNAPRYQYVSTTNRAAKDLILAIQTQLFSCQKFTNDLNQILKLQLEDLNKIMNAGIGISNREKNEILQAMGFSKGHWFKCPNGHIYAIGECGRAMEESRCNECGAKIGGRNHQRLIDNAVATEMDGAIHGAWPDRRF